MAASPTSKDSVLARTARGAGWMVAWRFLNRILGLLSVLILVRLLAPQDFGIVALAYTFISVVDALTSLSVETALLRAKDPDRSLYDTGFTINLIRSAVLGLTIAAAAGPVAAFYDNAELPTILYVLAIVALLPGLQNIGVVDFLRDLDYARNFKLLALPRLLQAVTGIAVAVVFRSYWALLAALLVLRGSSLLLTYTMHPYRPRLCLTRWRDLIGISFWTWAFSIGMTVRDRTESLVIGRVMSPTAVGLYNVSLDTAMMPTSEVIGPISQASLSGFAANIRDDAHGAAASDFMRVFCLATLLALPMGFGVSLAAGPAVILILGAQWRDAAELMQIFGVGSIGLSLGLIATVLLQAHLRLRLLTAITFAAAALRIAVVMTVLPLFGLGGLAFGATTVMLMEAAVLSGFALRLAGTTARAYLRGVWRPVMAVMVMVLVVFLSGEGWRPPPASTREALILCLVCASLGAATYGSTLLALWFLSGRPTGAETDLLALGQRFVTPVLRGPWDRCKALLPRRGAGPAL